ncbi:transmembrane cytochrome oxidase [Rhodoferax koreense]|uniref:SURF1-like protein n=1 Tax=Rhodoferax koreensis TaxID=1842727 RepID=A0A1P8K1A5_9BURK|nr:SURF1 family protein [Rhodoferax koreense]APW39790.1 transmembrane cytochrome oxidase [Rhodoferax koreense]
MTVAALLGLAATVSLGRWQLSRAAQKEALQAAIDAQNRLPAIDLSRALPGAPELVALEHRQAVARGRWLPRYTVFLDNRQMHGQPGFDVLTPLQLPGGGAVLLVQRGWVPRNFVDRTALPTIDSPAGEVEVRGRMAPPPGKLYEFGGGQGGAIRQNLDMAAFAAETGLPLLPVSLLQTGADETGGPLQRDWPAANLGVEKHYGYAFQWFGLATLIVFLYVWFQIVRRYFLPRRRQ